MEGCVVSSIDGRMFCNMGGVQTADDASLSECHPWAVCARVDTYGTPWAEKLCRCPGQSLCSLGADAADNHTLNDGPTRLLKTCRSVNKLPVCRLFTDTTWIVTAPGSGQPTETRVRCRCPSGSQPYLHRHSPTSGGGQRFRFACSPKQPQPRCMRKQPCRLFTVQKRSDVEEARAYDVCECPRNFTCASRHTERGVVSTLSSPSGPRQYTAYCTPSQST
ncbi:hypothetical protein LAZ67_9002443 [Cordylochernes scorpioides]|uniref:Uncharacterized protein n=1 Tax=Cordylochernes scorpioides TaxID=51811 RepID=A0ABY6KTX7_9ARAC|nr:hypothetical protein LAZ67_9002443 [Cordylochernes scorpioides]